MTSNQFREWRLRLGFTQIDASRVLDRSETWVGAVENGRTYVTRVVELACWAVEEKTKRGDGFEN